jgi:amino acid transporter
VSLGVVLHNTSLITFANTLSTPNNSFVIGAIFIVAFTLITLLGNRVYFAFQTIAFAFMIVAFLITVGVFATNSPVNFSNLIDKTFGAGTYNYMIDEFSKQGGYTLRPFFTAFLSGIVLWAGINTWSLGTSMIAGEIKQANKIKTWLISNVLGAIVVGVLFAITAQLYLSSVGEKFVYAATYLSGTQYYKIVFPPYYSSFVILASPSVILSVIFAIGFFLGGIFYMPQNQIIASRMMLAFAFDRLAPAKLGEVSERFHVPVISTLIALLISLVSLWIYVYTNWLGFFSQLFAVAFSFLLTSIAAIIFPYRRRELYEHSPANKKIAGIPLMSVLGFANAIFMGAFIYENWVDSALGSNSIQSVGLITGVLVFSFVLFWVIKWVRKKQGIDVDALFREIPPE